MVGKLSHRLQQGLTSVAGQILDRYLDKAAGFDSRLNKTVGFHRFHRPSAGQKLVEDMSHEERLEEFLEYALRDIEAARSETDWMTPERSCEYLVDRTLDPLDPMNEFYAEYLRRTFGATVKAGRSVKLPNRELRKHHER
jgi:hypothetical protein